LPKIIHGFVPSPEDIMSVLNEISAVTGEINDITPFENARCNKVYLVSAACGKYVLKAAFGESRKRELKNEAGVLRFLSGKTAVPAVLLYKETADFSYILMEYAEGETFQALLSGGTCDAPGIRGLGQTLREIHAVKLAENYDYCGILNFQLQQAENNMNNNMLDPDEFVIDGVKREPEQILRGLTRNRPAPDEVCLLHGDFRPKNIIRGDKNVNVVIDWGFCCAGDPYYDLAIILYYFGGDERSAFLEGYGAHSLDYERLRYFDYLSKFINV